MTSLPPIKQRDSKGSKSLLSVSSRDSNQTKQEELYKELYKLEDKACRGFPKRLNIGDSRNMLTLEEGSLIHGSHDYTKHREAVEEKKKKSLMDLKN